MASKTAHLKSGFHNGSITVDTLFEAAFGPAPREYQFKSLFGWRPLAPDSRTTPFRSEKKTAAGVGHRAGPSPGVKVYETDELIVVEVELPAIEAESLYLEISGDLLIIRGIRLLDGTRNRPTSSKHAGRKIYRYVQLPVTARPEEVRARLEGHTVRVMIRKLNGFKHVE